MMLFIIFSGEPETDKSIYPFLPRYKVWQYPAGQPKLPCYGYFIREVCIFTLRDLPVIAGRKELFLNKLFLTPNYHVLDCLEELHFNRTRQDYEQTSVFDLSPYMNLPVISNRVGGGIQMT